MCDPRTKSSQKGNIFRAATFLLLVSVEQTQSIEDRGKQTFPGVKDEIMTDEESTPWANAPGLGLAGQVGELEVRSNEQKKSIKQLNDQMKELEARVVNQQTTLVLLEPFTVQRREEVRQIFETRLNDQKRDYEQIDHHEAAHAPDLKSTIGTFDRNAALKHRMMNQFEDVFGCDYATAKVLLQHNLLVDLVDRRAEVRCSTTRNGNNANNHTQFLQRVDDFVKEFMLLKENERCNAIKARGKLVLRLNKLRVEGDELP